MSTAPALATESTQARRVELFLAPILAIGIVLLIYFTQSRFGDERFHGDFWSDQRITVMADTLAAYGFWNHKLGVPLDRGRVFGLEPAYYINHPSAYVIALAALRRFGVSDDAARLLPLFFSGTAIVALAFMVRQATGNARLALLTAGALAVSAPFRLLADSFCYQSYAVAAKTWAMLCIVWASLYYPQPRRGRLLLCAVAALAAITLVAHEVVPAIGLFAFFFPLVLGPGGFRDRLRSAVATASCVGVAFIVGMGLLLLHAAWMLGGIRRVIETLSTGVKWRTSTQYAVAYWGRSYPMELLHRAWAYFNVHLCAIGAGVAAVGLMSVNRRGLRLLGVLIISEVAWLLMFRQHSHQHVHTIAHLMLSITLLTGLVIDAVWTRVASVRFARMSVAVGGLAAAAIALSDVTLADYGNVVRSYDYTSRRADARELAEALPADAALIIELPGADSSVEYFLNRPFIRRPGPRLTSVPTGAPLYLLTSRYYAPETAAAALQQHRLVRATSDLLLFDLSAEPGLSNALIADSAAGPYTAWGRRVQGYAMHPRIPAIPEEFARRITLPAGPAEALRLSTTFPEQNIGLGDGVTLRVVLESAGGERVLSERFIPSEKPVSGDPWVTMDVAVPERDVQEVLRLEVDCGPRDNCDYDWVFVGMAGASN